MRRYELIAILLVTAALIPLYVGCGSSDSRQVVTRTVTETVTAEPAQPVATAADEAWAALVRRQSEQLTEVARRARGANSSYEFWEISNKVISEAGLEINMTSTVGLSPCMANVPKQWDAVLTGFTILGAAGTASATIELRDRTLATVNECVPDVSSASSTEEDTVTLNCIWGVPSDGPLGEQEITVALVGIKCDDAGQVINEAVETCGNPAEESPGAAYDCGITVGGDPWACEQTGHSSEPLPDGGRMTALRFRCASDSGPEFTFSALR